MLMGNGEDGNLKNLHIKMKIMKLKFAFKGEGNVTNLHHVEKMQKNVMAMQLILEIVQVG